MSRPAGSTAPTLASGTAAVIARHLTSTGNTVDIDGTTLRRLRQRRGLTQRDLATLCRITQSYVSRLEAGRSKRVSRPVFGLLCTALQPAPGDLLDLLDQPH